VIGEATWVTLLVNASYNTSLGPHVRLPFLAFAVPAAVAVAAVAATARLGWRRWKRGVLVAVVVAFGAVLTAGCIAALTVPGSAWRIAVLPWTARTHSVATVAGAAWLVAVAAWARGTSLTAIRPRFAHAAWSAAVSAAVFVGIFAGRAAPHDAPFRGATGDAGVLLFLFFPLTGAALLLIRQREIERDVLLRPSAGPGWSWLGVLAAPLLVLACLCLVVAAAARPAARGAGHAGLAGLEAIGRLLAALGRFLSAGASRGNPTIGPSSGAHPVLLPPANAVARHTVTVPGPVWAGLSLVAAAVLVWAVVRYVRPFRLRRWRPPPATDVDEERDTVFTWAHFAAQVAQALRRGLARLLALLRPRRRRLLALGGRQPSAAPSDPADGVDTEGVRGDYRRVLVAARQSGWPRGPAETTSEFERRLSPDLPHGGAAALVDLTGLYQRVRYGNTAVSETERERGRQAAGTIVDALTIPAHGGDEAPPPRPSA
jgi:hypothetical protein